MREKEADALWANLGSVIGGSACDVGAAVLDGTLTDAPDWLLMSSFSTSLLSVLCGWMLA